MSDYRPTGIKSGPEPRRPLRLKSVPEPKTPPAPPDSNGGLIVPGNAGIPIIATTSLTAEEVKDAVSAALEEYYAEHPFESTQFAKPFVSGPPPPRQNPPTPTMQPGGGYGGPDYSHYILILVPMALLIAAILLSMKGLI